MKQQSTSTGINDDGVFATTANSVDLDVNQAGPGLDVNQAGPGLNVKPHSSVGRIINKSGSPQIPNFGNWGLGLSMLWLSIIVLLPLAALTTDAFSAGGIAGFIKAATAPAALAAFRVTIWVSFAVALINAVCGLLLAWVLVRDDFPGKKIVNALIDLPFALPTIVASLVLLSLYGPDSPVGITINATQPALVLALAFVTLPFVVRAVQPVLLELDRDVEEAAASLGAKNFIIFTKIILPVLFPPLLSGSGLAFARAIGEYGSVVLIGGSIPGQTQMASQYIQEQIESDVPSAAAAVSVTLLILTFLVLLGLRFIGQRNERRISGKAAGSVRRTPTQPVERGGKGGKGLKDAT
ncbi:sulfate ABC transporter permease subunit CysT [Corynebacterium sp. 4HC-13]|uniref:sulfate ABC transporter permease subunit CysT n=1 Tax=Corynebacterium anserum TaxID=2684406 RepID=UPI00163991B1|nr:sulfate ABC transporter permease subunit CysT [Corynebacterium anserum]MBC2681273.1 sulfate ABC transporter permease subunit CysT [Corynebacterium anserum]